MQLGLRYLKDLGIKIVLGILAFGCAQASPDLQTGLTWKQKTIELDATAQSGEVTARFPFENKSTAPVTIESIESSCSCTTAILTQRQFVPGQGGEITATFTVGEHVGLQKKTISVKTSDRAIPTILTLIVHIPEVLHIYPASVSWKHSEKNTPKSLIAEVTQDTPPHDFTVQSSDPNFSVEVSPLQAGRKYLINVAPTRTDQNLFTTLTIRSTFGQMEKIFRAYATVQPTTAND